MTAADTIIIGFGHSARSFHLPAMPDLASIGLATGDIRVVDPRIDPEDPAVPRGARVFSRLADAGGDRNAVVHICTGPAAHSSCVLDAVRLGYHRFVVEKPMTTSLADARELSRLCGRGEADLVVVSNWAASLLTDELRRILREKSAVPVREMVLSQVKPRIERTLDNTTHRSAFEVEMPHLVALAMALVDEPLAVDAATCSDLVVGEDRRVRMGSASIRLSATSGLQILLRSELTMPWRERSARIEWADGAKVIGFHPCDSTDRYSQLFTRDVGSRRWDRRLFYDDTVRRLLSTAYSWFVGRGPRPPTDVAFGAAVASILETAERTAVSVEHRPEDLIEVGNADHIAR